MKKRKKAQAAKPSFSEVRRAKILWSLQAGVLTGWIQ
jgi:hypothetical protein